MAQRAEEGGVGGSGRGAGRGWGGGALFTGVAPPLCAAQPPAFSRRGGRLHLPPTPSQDGHTALHNGEFSVVFTRGHGGELVAPAAVQLVAGASEEQARVKTFHKWW